MVKRVEKSDAEWRSELTPMAYKVARQKGTERAFTGEYHDCKTPGVYRCTCCGTEVFNSEHKFDSGTGWPSFTRPIVDGHVVELADDSHGMRRVEVRSADGDSHLGHVFPDGPQHADPDWPKNPTGMRYCINSASLEFENAKEE